MVEGAWEGICTQPAVVAASWLQPHATMGMAVVYITQGLQNKLEGLENPPAVVIAPSC